MPFDLFEKILSDTLKEGGQGSATYNSELAPQNLLFEQAQMIEKMPAQERAKHEARLQEIKVVLIRTMISDQLAYLKIAKDWFTISDLSEIRAHKSARERSAANQPVRAGSQDFSEVGDDEIRSTLRLCQKSYFLGADLIIYLWR